MKLRDIGRAAGKIRVVLVFAVIIVFLGIAGYLKISSDPNVYFLLPKGGAQWIKLERPYEFLAQVDTREEVTFRKRFTVTNVPEKAELAVRAMRTAAVSLDGRLLLAAGEDLQSWKKTRVVGLDGLLPGEHELRITVFNKNGPAVLLAYSKALKLFTGRGWEARRDQEAWTPAILVGENKVTALSKKFPSTVSAFSSLFPLYAFLFSAVFGVSLYVLFSRRQAGWQSRLLNPDPSVLRWLLLAAWTLLAINNITKIPLDQGFDVKGHYAYVLYVAENWRIPLATEGWQTFQSPLYYLISAALFIILRAFFDLQTAALLLRAVPLICGALQVELSYRSVRYIFPARKDLQFWGTLIGGLLPMNLYMSQFVGNEPMAGVLSAGLVVMCFRLLRSGPDSLPGWYFVSMGILLGLSLLTKVTAVLLIPPLFLLIVYVMAGSSQPLRNTARKLLAVFGTAFVVSGWYYLRNWLELGSPFIGGWDVSRGIIWWQDPGYRTISDFISFGQSLLYPAYSATSGFWDSVYSTFWCDGFTGCNFYEQRPPWNYEFMISGALLSLLPAAAILVGVVRTARRGVDASQQAQVFSLGCIVLYFSALLYLYFTLPIYSTAKASYTLGILPCYVILCVSGLDLLSRNRLSRAAINGFLACWAIAAYFSYFAL